MDEFSLIGAYFKRAFFPFPTPQVDVSVGDDAALFRVPLGAQCVVSSDMLVEGRHFFSDVAPDALGHKALAVNLSDLAAMGAQPLGFTLSLGLPRADEAWLAGFAQGMFALGDVHRCPLIGGDTTRSRDVVINITIFGQVSQGGALLRSGACVGDDVWVTGELGDAAYALELCLAGVKGDSVALDRVRHRLERPVPRVAFGVDLARCLLGRGSMLDLSDGLAGDLRHILQASGVSARIDCARLPLSGMLQSLPVQRAWSLATLGGDDYELCFTASPGHRAVVTDLAKKHELSVTRIGTIMPMIHGAPMIDWVADESQAARAAIDFLAQGRAYNHFGDECF